jgi:hypothetical protein
VSIHGRTWAEGFVTLVSDAVCGSCVSSSPLIVSPKIISERRATPKIRQPLESPHAFQPGGLVLELREKASRLLFAGLIDLWYRRQIRHGADQPFDQDAIAIDDRRYDLDASSSVLDCGRTAITSQEFRELWLSANFAAMHVGMVALAGGYSNHVDQLEKLANSQRRPTTEFVGTGINSQLDGAQPPVPGSPAHRGAALLLYLLGR